MRTLDVFLKKMELRSFIRNVEQAHFRLEFEDDASPDEVPVAERALIEYVRQTHDGCASKLIAVGPTKVWKLDLEHGRVHMVGKAFPTTPDDTELFAVLEVA